MLVAAAWVRYVLEASVRGRYTEEAEAWVRNVDAALEMDRRVASMAIARDVSASRLEES